MTYLLLIIVVLTSKAFVLSAGPATFAGDGSDFFLRAVGKIARVGVVGGHFMVIFDGLVDSEGIDVR